MAKKLSLDEIKNLLIRWRALGDKKAFEKLVVGNSGLVGYFAKKYLGKGLSFEELVSAGNLSLINAINMFDYINRDIQGFSGYIGVSIENGMLGELRRYNKHSHVMSLSEPIGTSKDGDEMTLEDILATDDDELLDNVVSSIKNDIVREALLSLTTKEQKIILMRYGLDDKYKKTQAEIAELFGCSKQTIAKQEQKALVKMRHPRNTRKLKDFIEE